MSAGRAAPALEAQAQAVQLPLCQEPCLCSQAEACRHPPLPSPVQVCGRFALHPCNEEASAAHSADCQGRHARLASIGASQEVECGICYERVMGKLRPGERRFGLLACEHPFCLACIRGWRSHTDGGADLDNVS